MNTKEYNGWTNYETWLVNLWLDNSENTQAYWRMLAQGALQEAKPDSFFTQEERAMLDMAKMLQERIEEASPLTDANLYMDLLNGALQEVNWHEIARHMVKGVAQKEVA